MIDFKKKIIILIINFKNVQSNSYRKSAVQTEGGNCE